MSNTIFTNAKKIMSLSQREVDSAAIEKSTTATVSTEIQHLSIKECSVVAGGPQVENDPQL